MDENLFHNDFLKTEVWQYLDQLQSKDPAEYRKVIQKALKEGSSSLLPKEVDVPIPKWSLRCPLAFPCPLKATASTSTTKPKITELSSSTTTTTTSSLEVIYEVYINVCVSTKDQLEPYNESTNTVPMWMSELSEGQVDVVVHSGVVRKDEESPSFHSDFLQLLMQTFEDEHGAKFSSHNPAQKSHQGLLLRPECRVEGPRKSVTKVSQRHPREDTAPAFASGLTPEPLKAKAPQPVVSSKQSEIIIPGISSPQPSAPPAPVGSKPKIEEVNPETSDGDLPPKVTVTESQVVVEVVLRVESAQGVSVSVEDAQTVSISYPVQCSGEGRTGSTSPATKRHILVLPCAVQEEGYTAKFVKKSRLLRLTLCRQAEAPT